MRAPVPAPALSLALVLVLPLALAACVPQDGPPSGAEDFATYCASCHGTDASGNGEVSAHLPRHPADLTTLARRNGGKFPTTRVMARIWGMKGSTDAHAVMPQFGPLLDSELVPYDGGDGIETPTPIRLIRIAEYLKTVQG